MTPTILSAMLTILSTGRRAGRSKEVPPIPTTRLQHLPGSVLVLLLGVLAAACSEAETDTVALDCSGLGLSTSAAQPLDTVGVTGLPAEFGDTLYAEVTADTLTGYTLVDRTDAGAALRAPLHPAGTLEGGAVELWITDGQATCPALAFTVEALPPAPGEFEKAVTALRAMLAAEVESWGTTVAALRDADPDTLLPPLIPVRIAGYLIDHPENPRSLARLADDGEGHELMDALWARAGVARHLAEYAEAVAARPGPPQPSAAAAGVMRGSESAGRASGGLSYFAGHPSAARVSGPRAGATRSARVRSTPAASLPAVSEWFHEPDAQQLSWMMDESMRGEIATTGKAAEIFGVLETTLAAGTLLPRYGKLFGMYGAYFGTLYVLEGLRSKLLPRRFTTMTVEAGPTMFEEDNPGPGSIRKITVVAASEGLVLDGQAAEYLLGKLTRMPKKLRSKMTDFQSAVLDEFRGTINSAVVESSSQGSDLLDIPPSDFGPVDISDRKWRRINVIGDAVASVAGGEIFDYAPRQTGDATLRVATAPDQFGLADGQHISREIRLRVLPISVVVDPPSTYADPGDLVHVTATVYDALSPSVEAAVTGGTLVELEELGDWSRRPHQAPGKTRAYIRVPDPFDQTITVTLRSLADRFHLSSAPVRSGTASIHPRRLTIEPPPTQCLEATASLDLDVRELSDDEVRWSATDGSIDGDGVFEPDSEGTHTIIATSRADGSSSDTVEITIGDCRCYAHVSVTGAVSAEFVGHSVTAFGNMLAFGEDRDGGSTAALQVPGFEEGFTGTLQVRTAAVKLRDFGGVERVINSLPGKKAALTVTEWDGRYFTADFQMVAGFFGNLDHEDPPRVNVLAQINGYASPDPMVELDVNNPCDK